MRKQNWFQPLSTMKNSTKMNIPISKTSRNSDYQNLIYSPKNFFLSNNIKMKTEASESDNFSKEDIK